MWIDTTASETAAALETRLDGLGAKVHLTSHAPTSLAYSANGLVLRQKEDVSIWEFRSLTEAAAQKLATLSSDNTTTTIHYKLIGDSGEYAAVAIRTGTKTEYVPSRANEADGWHVTKTVTTLSADSATGWTTTRPAAAASGIVISESSSKECLIVGVLGAAAYQNETVVIREYPYLTYAEAHAKVGTEKAAGSHVYVEKFAMKWTTGEGYSDYKDVTIRGGATGSTSQGTDKVPTMRYDGPERGWVVTVTETTYWGSAS